MSRKWNFTLLELLVVICVIGILSGMVFGAVNVVRQNRQRIACRNNLKQLGIAISNYQNTFDNRFPNADSLPSFFLKNQGYTVRISDALKDYTGTVADVFHCPADMGENSWYNREGSSYEFNAKLSNERADRFHEIVKHGASQVVVLFDYECVHADLPKLQAKNYLFADGHVGDID